MNIELFGKGSLWNAVSARIKTLAETQLQSCAGKAALPLGPRPRQFAPSSLHIGPYPNRYSTGKLRTEIHSIRVGAKPSLNKRYFLANRNLYKKIRCCVFIW